MFAVLFFICFTDSGIYNKLNFATNSASIGWYKSNNKKADYFFWIDPPWRIVNENKIILNSYNYPYHENYTEDEKAKEKDDFKEWVSKADFLSLEKVSKVVFSDIGDLKIIWNNKCQMDTFVNDVEECSYHFYDYVSWIDYEIFPGRIEINEMEKRER